MIWETCERFRDKAAWDRWAAAHPEIFDPGTAEAAVSSIRRCGLFDPFSGYVRPDELVILGSNYREDIFHSGVSSRIRAVFCILRDIVEERGSDIDVYACEVDTALARRLAAIFRRFVGSEYRVARSRWWSRPKTRQEDIQNLSFAAESFDVYVNCEVLEHVPYVDLALREARRILRPGGIFFGTVPLLVDSLTKVVRARLKDGAIEHLLEPEIHGNPTDPIGGSLVFEVPGWDLLERMKEAGFSDAQLCFVISRRHGVIGSGVCGVHVFYAVA